MYFTEQGKAGTQRTVELALRATMEKSIGHIVIASNSGETVKHLIGSEINVVCVTHAYGFAEKGKNEMPDDVRAYLMEHGIKVITTTHVLSGVERGLSSKFGGMYPAEIMAHTLRMFGQGIKVCVEIAVMALDAGLIPYGEKIIALGGTGEGTDTAALLTPAHAQHVLETRIHEIICKPEL